MADIIRSRTANQSKLMSDFKEIARKTNASLKDKFLSPITITLGDEFQSIARNVLAAVTIILTIEESMVLLGKNFKFRYVLLEGKIDTSINKDIAYEMLGSGLTKAREALGNLKKTKSRFTIILQDQARGHALHNSFLVFQSIIDGWKPGKDYYIVAEFLRKRDYKEVAIALNKERSLMWKREKSLQLNEYFALKEVIKYIGGNKNV